MHANALRLRTNLMTLVTSAALLYSWLWFVAQGADADLPDRRALGDVLWFTSLLSLVVAAVGLQFLKDLRTKRQVRRALGAAVSVPFAFLIWYGWTLGVPTLVALAVPSLACTLFALWIDEEETGSRDRDLATISAGVILAVLPLVAVVMGAAAALPLPMFVVAGMAVLGAGSLAMQRARPGSPADRALRVLLGLSFLALCVASWGRGQYVSLAAMAPFALALLAHPALAHYRAGLAPSKEAMTDEATAIFRYIKTDERAGWIAVSVVTVLCFLYPPMLTGTAGYLMSVTLFSIIFVVQYRVFDPAKVTYRHYHSMMYGNVLGIWLQGHFSGGLDSPFMIFMPFMAWAGLVTPRAAFITRQVIFVSAMIALEAALSWRAGTLTEAGIFLRLLPVALVSLLIYVFIRHVALEQNQFNERLHEANVDLQHANKRDAALFTALADAILVCSPDGTIAQTNPAAEELIGRGRPLVGKRPDEVLSLRREDGVEYSIETLVAAAKGGRSSRIPDDLFTERDGGARAYLAGYVTPFTLEGGALAGVIVTVRDITAVHEADKVKSDFLSIAAHQLRTPLTNIRWHLELVKETAVALEEQVAGFVANAHDASRRMVSLINGILAAARLESGRVPFKPEPVVMKELLQEVVEAVRERADEKKLRIALEAPEMEPVSLDPTLAREVFKNVVENAVRYTPEGGKIRVLAEDRPSEIVVTVADDGIGIPADQQKKIFVKFFRAKNAIAHAEEGTGLGLFLARYIANAWGGDITFESALGKGTTFHVTVPKRGMAAKEGEISLRV